MTNRHVLALALAAAGLLATPLAAQAAPQRQISATEQAAQAAFDQAQTDFLARKWTDAAAGFERTQAILPRPQFVYNAAAAYYYLGLQTNSADAYGKSIAAFRRYLRDTKATSGKPAADATTVESRIQQMQAAIAELRAKP